MVKCGVCGEQMVLVDENHAVWTAYVCMCCKVVSLLMKLELKMECWTENSELKRNVKT